MENPTEHAVTGWDNPSGSAAGTVLLRGRVEGEAYDSYQITSDGLIKLGDGTAEPTTAVTPGATVNAYTQTYSTANRTIAAQTTSAITDNTTGSTTTTFAATVGVYNLVIPIDMASLANADVLTNIVPGHKFKILKTTFACTKAVTTGAKAATLNLEIGTTNVTGGELTLSGTYALGAIAAGAAVTAANTGTSTDTLSIEASSVTTFIEGAGVVIIEIQNMDTADAFAGIVTQLTAAKADDLDNRQSINAIVDDLQARNFAS